MLLTADDLAELTGYRSPQGQRRWLDDRGWRYEVARDGSPRVARAYFLMRMGLPVTDSTVTKPDWTAIK